MDLAANLLRTAEQLPDYRRMVWITDALPLGPSGKILKRGIKIPISLEQR